MSIDDVSVSAAAVTGAGHGIGLATAHALAPDEYKIIAVDKDHGALERADLPAGSLRVVHDLADVSFDVLATVPDGLRVGVLVNNVGVMDGRSFLELPVADAARVLQTNIVGSWAVTRAVVNHMLARGVRSSIVFNLSLHASRPRMCPDYSMSKAALAMLMQELAVDLGPAGIRVNAVSPGAIDTGQVRGGRAMPVVGRGCQPIAA